MATRALAVGCGIVLELRGLKEIVVATEAGFLNRLFELSLVIRTVWIVTFGTTGFQRLMFHFAFGERIIMAFETDLRVGFKQQGLVIRSMRRMATHALAIGCGIVLELRGLEEIIVALKALGGDRLFEQPFVGRAVRIVALEAIGFRWLMFHLALIDGVVMAFEAH